MRDLSYEEHDFRDLICMSEIKALVRQLSATSLHDNMLKMHVAAIEDKHHYQMRIVQDASGLSHAQHLSTVCQYARLPQGETARERRPISRSSTGRQEYSWCA